MSKAWWNPRKPGGVRFVHLVVVLILAVVAVVIAYNVAQQTAFRAGEQSALAALKAKIKKPAYWAQRKAPLPVPQGNSPIFTAPGAPAQGTRSMLDLKALPSTTDQGLTGSCQCQAAAYYQGTFVWRMLHPNQWIKFSAGYCYDYVRGGIDTGSNFPEDVAFWGGAGIARYRYMPAQGYRPAPLPVGIPVIHFPVAYDTLFVGIGAGQGGVDLMRSYLAAGRILNMDTPDWASTLGSANANGGNVGMPRPNQSALDSDPTLIGGHAVTCVGFDDNHAWLNPNTGKVERGAFFCVTSWGRYYGLNRYGAYQLGNGGFFWYSYEAARTYAYGVFALKAAPTGANGVQSYQNAPKVPPGGPQAARKLFRPTDYVKSIKTAVAKHEPGAIKAEKALTPSAHVSLQSPGATNAWYVQRVYAITASGAVRDIAPLINAASDYVYRTYGFKVWPVGIAATSAIESGLHEVADHYGPWCDVSFGPFQFTVCTAAAYGIGDGSGSASNVSYVRYYENSYDRMAPKAAQLLGRYGADSCTSFPNTYISYNAGGGYGCGAGIYSTPCVYNAVACRAYGQFLVWFDYALSHWAYTGSTPPYVKTVVRHVNAPTFHAKAWYLYLQRHHKSLAHTSPWAAKGGKLTWGASVWRYYQGLKGLKGPEHYYPHGRYTLDRFAKGKIYMWARFHSVKVVGADGRVLYKGRWPQ